MGTILEARPDWANQLGNEVFRFFDFYEKSQMSNSFFSKGKNSPEPDRNHRIQGLVSLVGEEHVLELKPY